MRGTGRLVHGDELIAQLVAAPGVHDKHGVHARPAGLLRKKGHQRRRVVAELPFLLGFGQGQGFLLSDQPVAGRLVGVGLHNQVHAFIGGGLVPAKLSHFAVFLAVVRFLVGFDQACVDFVMFRFQILKGFVPTCVDRFGENVLVDGLKRTNPPLNQDCLLSVHKTPPVKSKKLKVNPSPLHPA